MNEPQDRQSEILSAWLKVATDRLCESAKARITLEIEAHYREAVAFHETEGKSSLQAQRSALDELGDPKSAARKLRRKHLTRRQLEWLKEWEKAAQKQPSRLATVAISIPLIVTLANHEPLVDTGLLPFGWLIFVLIPWVHYSLHRIYPAESTVSSLLLVGRFFVPAFGIAILSIADFYGPPLHIVPELRWLLSFEWSLVIVGFLIACAHGFYWLGVWRKSRNEPLYQK